MALTLKVRRLRAYVQQRGLCFYCGLPMLEGDKPLFRKLFRLSDSEAESLRCTAEHLVAQKDGGTDGNGNVVAACHACNQGRHQRKRTDLAWQEYKALVERRMAAGRWRTQSLLLKLAGPLPGGHRRWGAELVTKTLAVGPATDGRAASRAP